MRSISHLRSQLHSPIDWSWSEDQKILSSPPNTIAIHPKQMCVLSDGWEKGTSLPLKLNSQQIDAVDFRQDVVQTVTNFDSHSGNVTGNQCRWSANDHSGSQSHEAMNIGSGHTAVTDVADKCHRQPGDSPTLLANGENVEQSLCGMFMSPVAGIQYAGSEISRQQMRSSGSAMAADHHVHTHRFNREGRVDKRFAFRQTAGTGRKIHRVSSQSPGGEAETGSSSRGILKKQIGDHLSLKDIQALRSALSKSAIMLGQIKNGRQLFGGQSLEAKQMLLAPGTA